MTVARTSKLALLAIAGALSLASSAAVAGECPADKVIATSDRAVMTQPKGVADTVIASIDLAELNQALKDSKLRLRRLVIEPGGVVPNHSHEERPANILMLEGSITEYRSTCAVPIEHRAGEVVSEFGHLAHWWRNNGNTPAVLISADLLGANAKNPNMM